MIWISIFMFAQWILVPKIVLSMALQRKLTNLIMTFRPFLLSECTIQHTVNQVIECIIQKRNHTILGTIAASVLFSYYKGEEHSNPWFPILYGIAVAALQPQTPTAAAASVTHWPLTQFGMEAKELSIKFPLK